MNFNQTKEIDSMSILETVLVTVITEVAKEVIQLFVMNFNIIEGR